MEEQNYEERKKKVLDRIEEIKKEIKKRNSPIEAIDYFFIGFAVGSNYEASYYDFTNYDSLFFWAKLKDIWLNLRKGGK